MPTRGFAYNPTQSSVSGASNVGTLCIQEQALDLASSPGGLTWWMGPVESGAYIIAKDVPTEDFPTPLGNIGGVQFWSCDDTDQSLIDIVTILSGASQATAIDAYNWLVANDYWTNFDPLISSGLIVYWDMGKVASYPGSERVISNLAEQSYANGAIAGGTVEFSTNDGGYLVIDDTNSTPDWINMNSSLNSRLSPVNTSTVISTFLWIRPTGNGVILQETSRTGWHDSQIEMVNDTLKFSVWPYTNIITSSISTPLNNWYYVGFVYDGTSLTAYVNGSIAGTATYARETPYNDGGGLSFFYSVGLLDSTNLGDGGYGNFGFGAMHVYNTALSGTDVLYNFNATKTRFGL
jgi:hypothetical protein